MKNSFVCYNDLLDSIEGMSMEQRGMLLTAMLTYSRDGEVSDLDPVTAIAFSFVKTTMDSDAKKYQERCDQNSENGKKGGRPKKANANDKTEKTERFSKKQTQAKKADNDSDNDLKENLSAKAESQKKSVRFSPPTVEEVAEYVQSRNSAVDPERFVDFYASKGWKVGNQLMKDWKAAVRTWEKRKNSTNGPPVRRTYSPMLEHGENLDDIQRQLAKASRVRAG